MFVFGVAVHVLRRDSSKLEARSEVGIFIGYPKGTKGYLFYDPKEQRVLVSTNARFLEQNYMLDNKPRSKIILDELRAEINKGNEVSIPETTVNQPLVVRTQKIRVPRRSGRVVTQPERFIGLEEIPVDPETDPSNFNEAIQYKDVTLWQSAMKTEMESMYSNQVWLLIDPHDGVKLLVASGSIREREG